MTSFAKATLSAVLALAVSHGIAQAASNGCCQPSTTAASAGPCCQPAINAFPGCQYPTTKSYRIRPEYCPEELVAMIPRCVSDAGCCVACGSSGIPPIYAVGGFVMVRQTPAVHARIAEYLASIGALDPPRKR